MGVMFAFMRPRPGICNLALFGRPDLGSSSCCMQERAEFLNSPNSVLVDE